MTSQPLELEGTWEEIVAHSQELAGRRVRLIVLSQETETPPDDRSYSTAQSLLQYAKTWEGEDFEECLGMVYNTRSPLEF